MRQFELWSTTLKKGYLVEAHHYADAKIKLAKQLDVSRDTIVEYSLKGLTPIESPDNLYDD